MTSPSDYVQLVNLDMMEQTVRRMTARYTQAQMTTAQVYRYINLFYTLHFPNEFKTLKLNKPYVFLTQPNVDTYPFPYQQGDYSGTNAANGDLIPGNVEITPPVFCQGYMLRYFQDKSIFYMRWPKLSVNQIVNQGTGLVGEEYSGTIPGFPFLRAQLDIQGNVTEAAVIISSFDNTGYSYAITDQPQSGDAKGESSIADLVDTFGRVVGEVNYITGAYEFIPLDSLGAPASIPAGAQIYASVVPYQASRPVDVIFTNQQLTFRPVPAQVFQIEFQVSQQPTQLFAAGQAPELNEWYLFICAGAGKLIYADFPDPDGMEFLEKTWQEQLQLAQRRTLKQYGTQRANTIFSTPSGPRFGYFNGNMYSGS